uniref:hypothetical protein n=1 Tax=Escherichia coli TaxID=562 RepID=UPI0020332486|nr:hypothetical protein [Escherichia coli]
MHQGGVNSLALALTAAFCGANQHNHGLLVSVITITYRVKKREKTCKYDLKVVLLFHRKGNGPSHNSPAGQEI